MILSVYSLSFYQVISNLRTNFLTCTLSFYYCQNSCSARLADLNLFSSLLGSLLFLKKQLIYPIFHFFSNFLFVYFSLNFFLTFKMQLKAIYLSFYHSISLTSFDLFRTIFLDIFSHICLLKSLFIFSLLLNFQLYLTIPLYIISKFIDKSTWKKHPFFQAK